MNRLIISNSCVGWEIYKRLDIEYMTPFIGTLIPNDLEYIKLCNNIIYYININPTCDLFPKNNTVFERQTNSKYYKYPSIKTPYPIIHLEDIDIHCIHETRGISCEAVLAKFNKRRLKMINIINDNNYKIINTLAYTELFNNHDNIANIINLYFNNKNNNNIINLFVGPSKYNNLLLDKDNIYLEIKEWDNTINPTDRNNSHVIKGNNQYFLGSKIYEYIIKNI